MALSFAMDGFTEAVLQEVLAARNTIALEAPRAVRARESAEKTVGDAVAAGETAASLFRKIVTARNPRVVAGPWEDAEVRRVDRARRVPVTHVAYSPAPASLLKSISGKYGAVADELLAVYAIHNGAELFMAEGEAGFCLVPIEHWGEMLAHAMEWAEDVTWQDEEEEIPSYLRSAIAFGLIPGDHERWILVTEGPHAGTVMLSDTDVIDDEPRFRTLADFFGTLLLDSARILNSGGHVRYGPDDQEVFPIRYEFD